MKKYLLFFLLLVTMNGYAQLRTGLLIGAGVGFDRNVTPNMNNSSISEQVANGSLFSEDYKFNIQLGYRFRFEDKKHSSWFYDIDPILNVKFFSSKKLYREDV